MARHALWAALEQDLAEAPGTVSVYCGRLGRAPDYTRLPDAEHYAASTMKVAVLAALYRTGADLDAEIPVRNTFASAAPHAPAYGCQRGYDNDDAVWDRLGGTASLGWLARRMIVRSSNLATNLVLAEVGLPAVAEVWKRVGARHSMVARGIEDSAAADAGIANLVTAADLAALLTAIALGGQPGAAPVDPLASVEQCRQMVEILLAQEGVEDLAAGLPPGTRIAHKNGWVRGIRHGAGVVFPDDAPPFVLAVCTTTPWAINEQDDAACQLVAQVARTAWSAMT